MITGAGYRQGLGRLGCRDRHDDPPPAADRAATAASLGMIPVAPEVF